MEYFKEVYFIYNEESKSLLQEIEVFNSQINIIAIDEDAFLKDTPDFRQTSKHILLSVSEDKVSQFFELAYKYNLSLGLVPLLSHKQQIKNFHISQDMEENIELALRDDCKGIDLVEINETLIYTHGIIGTIPLIGDNLQSVRSSFFKTSLYALKKFFSLELQKFDITTKNGQNIITSAVAVVILNHEKSGFLSKIFNFEQSMRDGEITIAIISPSSLFEYIELLSSIFKSSKGKKTLPNAISFMKSESFTIKASSSKRLNIHNANSIALPVECRVIPQAIQLNASELFWQENEKKSSSKETIKVSNILDANESARFVSKHISFFKSASEERFKELFQILRLDAKVNVAYLVLMVLSTLLASFGLFANSAAVIIGAMLVAPLMIPIVSISMGLLRADAQIIGDSFLKIGVGVFVAILA